MFGYITINKGELKVKRFDYYQSCYCGLCHTLGSQHGIFSQMTLTFDMTFLSMLLTSLYEEGYHGSHHHCVMHPLTKHTMRENSYTAYAADMTILLSYHNMMDDWKDDHNVVKLSMAKTIQKAYDKVAKKYPRQTQAVLTYLDRLEECEQDNVDDLDLAAGLTGQMMREIFICREDSWQEILGSLGFYLGKFIYLMDAYEDIEEDRRKGNYNPFLFYAEEPDFEERGENVLNLMGAAAAREFEKLPLLVNTDILRNVLYSGIWMKHAIIRKKRTQALADASKEQNASE